MGTDLNEQIRELIDGGARPVSSGEIMGRRPATVARLDPEALPKHRPRRAATVAAGAAAAGAAVTITVALLGGAAGPDRSGHVGTVLTAAMVRQVAAASGSALAHAGHLRISYSDVSSLDPGSRGAGTDDITFAGKNWNYVSDQTAPPNGRSINRFVSGRLYYYGRGFLRHPGDPLRWFRETNPREIRNVTSVTAPDPRELLRVLDPTARFVRVGYQVIGGVRVEQLRATRLGHLPGLGAVPGEARPIGWVTSLDVWVDSHGVVRRMHLTSQKHVYEYIPKSYGKKLIEARKNGLRVMLKVPKNGRLRGRMVRVPVPHDIERASAWVSFLDIGKPETLTAPAHAIPVYGRG